MWSGYKCHFHSLQKWNAYEPWSNRHKNWGPGLLSLTFKSLTARLGKREDCNLSRLFFKTASSTTIISGSVETSHPSILTGCRIFIIYSPSKSRTRVLQIIAAFTWITWQSPRHVFVKGAKSELGMFEIMRTRSSEGRLSRCCFFCAAECWRLV